MQKAKRRTPAGELKHAGDPPSGISAPDIRAKARMSRRVDNGVPHGRRLVRDSIALDDMIDAVMGDDRLEIVVALAHRPRSVGELQEWIGARRIQSVTDQLLYLQEFGVVTWAPDGTRHIYRLTERIRAFPEDGNVQLVVISPAGHWVLINFDEGGGSGRIVVPPTRFLDPGRIEHARCANAALPSSAVERYHESATESRRLHHRGSSVVVGEPRGRKPRAPPKR